MKKFLLSLSSILIFALAPIAFALAWPASGSSTEIGTALLSTISDFEPSGIIWHSGRDSYIVVSDTGDIAELESDGTVIDTWSPRGNWEGITVADTSSDIVYLANENASSIYAFDLSSGTLTGDTWSVYPISLDGYNGFEALTWVPDGSHPYGSTVSGGVFYAGWQKDADIYVFEPDLSSSGTITYRDEIRTSSGYSDLSGLYFSEATGTVFTVYDAANRLEERATDGSIVSGRSYTIPGGDGAWEGLAMVDTCPTSADATLALADDGGGINTFSSFEVDCLIVDSDGDGVYSDVDCNDADSTVSSDQTYYEDSDGDGFGNSAVSTSICSSTPPSGYVDNSEDLYDNARIEICNDGKDNDGDRAIDEANILSSNGPHVLYSTYSASTDGYISSALLTGVGMTRITYIDGSCYDYLVFREPGPYALIPNAGTSYYTAKRGSQTGTLNGLTGSVTTSGAWPNLLITKHKFLNL